jgi:hypothetical protein
MKPPSPDVLNALQECLRYERTAFEYFHDLEHAMERRGWKELEKLLDKWVDKARRRRHRLIKRIYEYDAIPDPASDSYEIEFLPSKFLDSIQDLAQSAIDCYTKGIPVLFDAKAFGKPLKTMMLNLKCNQALLLSCEQILQQIETLGGDAAYLAEQM